MKYILIGGTMESKFALEHVATIIKKLQPGAEVSTYTFAFALSHKHEINRVIHDNFLITHSSGAMVIERGANPGRAVFVSPLQPVSRIKLTYRAFIKTVFHSWRVITRSDRDKTFRILLSNLFEMLIHPIANMKPFLSGDMSRFDLRAVLPRHPIAGTARVVLSTRDEMFTDTENYLGDLESHGVEIVHVDAMHDEIFIDTKKVMEAVLKS